MSRFGFPDDYYAELSREIERRLERNAEHEPYRPRRARRLVTRRRRYFSRQMFGPIRGRGAAP